MTILIHFEQVKRTARTFGLVAVASVFALTCMTVVAQIGMRLPVWIDCSGDVIWNTAFIVAFMALGYTVVQITRMRRDFRVRLSTLALIPLALCLPAAMWAEHVRRQMSYMDGYYKVGHAVFFGSVVTLGMFVLALFGSRRLVVPLAVAACAIGFCFFVAGLH